MKLGNEPYSRITLMALTGEREPVGLHIMQEPGNMVQVIDFRHVKHATMVIHENRNVEVLLVIRPRQLTEVDRVLLEARCNDATHKR